MKRILFLFFIIFSVHVCSADIYETDVPTTTILTGTDMVRVLKMNGPTSNSITVNNFGIQIVPFLTGTTSMSIPWGNVLSVPSFITSSGTSLTISGTLAATHISGTVSLSGTSIYSNTSGGMASGTLSGITSLTGTLSVGTSGTTQVTGSNGILSVNGNVINPIQQVTVSFNSLGASSSITIPIRAKGWSVSFIAGSGTIGGISVPAGFSDSDQNTLLSTITVTTNAASSAYVRYNN